MSEIEILLPTVTYGNVKLRGTPEEFGVDLASPGSIGEMVAVYLNLFTQGFQAGALRDVMYIGGDDVRPEPDGPTETYWDATQEQHAEALVAEGLGATVVEDDTQDPEDVDGDPDAPWSKTTVEARPKPWETGGTAPKNAVKVAEINW